MRVGVVVTLVAALALLASATSGAGSAAAAVKAPPKSVLVLKATWNPAGETPGSFNWIPLSSLSTVSQQASDRMKDASHGAFGGWSTTARGPFQIAAPRADGREEEAPFRIGCGTQFFSDLSSRTDAAARAAGVNPDAADLVIYAFDDSVCSSMPEGTVSAGLIDGRRIALEGETTAGGLVDMVGHYMGLGHANSIRCTNQANVPVPLETANEAQRCQTNPGGDVYDAMGSGYDAESKRTGGLSAAAQNALGWLGSNADPANRQYFDVQFDSAASASALEIASISNPTDGTVRQRAIRVQEGSNVYWVEYRTSLGADAGLRATPGLIVRRELATRTAAGAPLTQLLDMSPATPITDAGLPVGQSWTNPAGNFEITFTGTGQGSSPSAIVRVGSRTLPGPVPPPRSVLVLPVEWGASGAVPATKIALPGRHAEASERASAFFKDSSHGFFGGWKTTTTAPLLIPTPGGPLSGPAPTAPVACPPQFFASLFIGADQAARVRGINPDAHDLVVYAFDTRVCQQMPEARFDAGLLDRRRLVFQSSLRPSSMAHMVGHYVGLGEAGTIRCKDGVERPVPLEFFKEAERCTTNPADDPYDVMGAATGAFGAIAGVFGAPVQNTLGWLGSDEDPETKLIWNLGESETARKSELPIAPIGDPFDRSIPKRAVRIKEGASFYWIEYRTDFGADAGLGATPGLIVRREIGRTAAGAPITQLLDMNPTTPMTDAGLPAGQTWAAPTGKFQITFNGPHDEGFDAAIVKVEPKSALPPQPLPHPLPPEGQLPDPNRSMLVINVGWNAPNAADSAPLDPSLLDRTAANINGAMNFWYRRSAPPGHYLNRTAYVGGNYTIPTPEIGVPLTNCKLHSDEAGDFVDWVSNHAEEKAEEAGLDIGRFEQLVFVYPKVFCFGGHHSWPSGNIMLGRRDVSTVVHEMGHYFNLNHAEALNCHAGVGVRVTLSSNCTREEYGDPVDPMGGGGDYTPGTFGAVNANYLGWLDDQYYNVADGFDTVTRTIKPFGETVPDGRKRAMLLRDGDTKLWIEYRYPVGVDAPSPNESGELRGGAVPGLYVHREAESHGIINDIVDSFEGPYSELIDMTPQTGFGDSGLDVGKTWANPLGVMQVTLNSAGPGGANITISRKPRPVTVPDLEGATEAEAKSKLESLGLIYGGVIDYIDDCDGTNIGKVMKTLPSAGTNVALSTAVTVKIGQKPRQMGNCQ